MRFEQVPEFEELKACVKAIKDSNPELGIGKVHKAVKEQNPTWQVVLSPGAGGARACCADRPSSERSDSLPVTALPRALSLTALPRALWLAAVFRRTCQEDSARDRGDCRRQIEEGRGTSLAARRARRGACACSIPCSFLAHTPVEAMRPTEDKQHT